MSTSRQGSLLAVDDLHVEFRSHDRTVRAVRGISYRVHEGETVAILGESGCGKTVGALAVMGLVDFAGGHVTSGSIRLRGRELANQPESVWRDVRAKRIAMIFQDPQTSLNPVFTIGWQLGEIFRQHLDIPRRQVYSRALELLERVRVPDPRAKMRSYPHELSGGMRQRVLVAMALALDPEVLVADEPTTALDATVTSEIIDLLRDLSAERRMGIVLITHDVEVASTLADRVAVMYAGRIVEMGPTSTVLSSPRHPYTSGLLAATPRLHAATETLVTVPGAPPDLARELPPCAFAPRCGFVHDRCRVEHPELKAVGDGHTAACHLNDLRAETA